MPYQVVHQHGFDVVSLNGEIDLACAPMVRKLLLSHLKRNNPLLVDLSDVEYIDSSGIACLVEAYQYARTQPLDFALLGVSVAVLGVLRLARLDTVFPIYANLAQRLAEDGQP